MNVFCFFDTSNSNCDRNNCIFFPEARVEGCHPLGWLALGSNMLLSESGGGSSLLTRSPCALGDPTERVSFWLRHFWATRHCFIKASSQLSLPNFIFSTPSVSSTERLTKVDLGILGAYLPGCCIAFLKFAVFATLVWKSLHRSVSIF